MSPYAEIERRVQDAKSLDELTTALNLLLSGGFSVWTDGSLYEIKQPVAQVQGLRIEVFSREHAPPHFHVSSSDIDAVFSVADCSLIRGTIDGRSRKLVEWWYERGRNTIVAAWNSTRPSDCPVGPIV